MQQPATIKLFLVHGSPNGLRTAELSNWSGKAIAAPRSELANLVQRAELQKPGVYLLTGVDPDSGEKTIYIGEAEHVALRLNQHKSKDFWNAATVFVSKDENLTKAHIRYLEGKLIDLSKELDSSILINSVKSGAQLPESDKADMEGYFSRCLQLLPVLGVSDFVKPIVIGNSKKNLLFCKIKGLAAKGKRTQNGFVVLKGSQAVLEHRASAKSMKNKREELILKGILEKMSGHYLFTRDIEFGSPSTAGGIVTGGSTNGLIAWKNSEGKTLKEIEAN